MHSAGGCKYDEAARCPALPTKRAMHAAGCTCQQRENPDDPGAIARAGNTSATSHRGSRRLGARLTRCGAPGVQLRFGHDARFAGLGDNRGSVGRGAFLSTTTRPRPTQYKKRAHSGESTTLALPPLPASRPPLTAMPARQLEIARILDRSYHIAPAASARSTTTWGTHDPDFRPFLPSRSPSSASLSSCYSPPRASFDLPIPIVTASPPSKAERRAARRDLDPILHEAVRAHERQLAQARRPSWLSRRKPQVDPEDEDDTCDVPVFEDDDDDYDTPVETPKRAPRRDRIRLQLVSLELRVDLAVFRAKKRLRARFGLS